MLLLGPYHFCPLSSPSFHEYSLGISNFLEEISSLSHSVVFLYFFALIAGGRLFISPCYSLELCIQMGISFFLSFVFCFFSFHSYLLRPPQTAIGFFAFLFFADGLDSYFLYNAMNLHPQFFRHSVC